MPLDLEKQEKLKTILKLTNDGLSEKKFALAFKSLVDFIKKVRIGLENNFNTLEANINAKVSRLKDGANGKDGKNGLDGKNAPIPVKGIDYFDGKDADEKRVIKKTLKELVKEIPNIKKIIKGIKVEKIRDSLEKLEGDERLEISSINGLEERLEKRLGKVSGGGLNVASISIRTVDNELLGTGDGIETDFTLNHYPSPATTLHIMVGTVELFLTDDWSLSGKVVSFLTAPPNGAKIRATYRIG